jgi:1-acyl-sn-glycerol-3-phosphate acyltransferase
LREPDGVRFPSGVSDAWDTQSPTINLTRPDERVPELGEPGTALVPVSPREEPPGRTGDVDPWGRSERVRARTRRVFEPLYKRYFRVEWQGLEHIPRAGGALLVANHAGAIPSDAPVIMHGVETELERPVYGLAEFMFRDMPIVGTMWARSGGVTAHPDNAYRLMHDDGQLVLVFPEGTKATGKLYRDRYKLRRFGRGGFVEIAMRSGAPVVPIAVVGAEESMPIVFKSPRLSRMVGAPYVPITANMLLLGPVLGLVGYFPAKFKLRVLPPVHFDVEPNQERYSHSRVMDEADRIRGKIQDALWDMLRARRSVWFG